MFQPSRICFWNSEDWTASLVTPKGIKCGMIHVENDHQPRDSVAFYGTKIGPTFNRTDTSPTATSLLSLGHGGFGSMKRQGGPLNKG